MGKQVNGPGQLWVSDITYLRIRDGFVYLSLLTDAYSRKIVGFHLSQHLKAQSLLMERGIKISMTQNGSPYENALAERVNGILKDELGLDKTFASYADAIAPTHRAIDIYNRLRPHMSCGYLTPEQAHLKQGNLKKAWKSNFLPVKFFQYKTLHAFSQKQHAFCPKLHTYQIVPILLAFFRHMSIHLMY